MTLLKEFFMHFIKLLVQGDHLKLRVVLMVLIFKGIFRTLDVVFLVKSMQTALL